MVEDAISFWTDIQRYENMLAADPRSYCFAPLSELYRKLGLLDDALSVAEKGCKTHPDYAGGFVALGNALCDKGVKDKARQALERALELQPDSAQPLKLLGQLYVEAGEIERAKVVLKQLLKQTPGDTEASLLLQSIAAGERAPAEEELLEDLDLLEDLEVLEELPEELPEPAALQGAEGSARSEAAAAPAPPEPEIGWGFGPAAESDDFWAIEATDEEPAQEFSRPFEEIEDLEAIPPVTATQHAGRDPLTTATLAELYVSQGFIDKALDIYHELLQADPGNHSYRSRCTVLAAELLRQQERQPQGAPVAAAPEQAPAPGEIQAAPAAETPVPEPGIETAPLEFQRGGDKERKDEAHADFEGGLLNWLENLRRRRDGV